MDPSTRVLASAAPTAVPFAESARASVVIIERVVFTTEDPRTEDIRVLLEDHLRFANEVTPPGHVHALDTDGLRDPSITLIAARFAGTLLGVGALRHLDDTHGEIKSMHTTASERGNGVGRAMAEHLLEMAASRGYRRVSLETGAFEAFVPARALYATLGFEACEPFADYARNPFSVCMTLLLPVDKELG